MPVVLGIHADPDLGGKIAIKNNESARVFLGFRIIIIYWIDKFMSFLNYENSAPDPNPLIPSLLRIWILPLLQHYYAIK